MEMVESNPEFYVVGPFGPKTRGMIEMLKASLHFIHPLDSLWRM